jgi:hypothetical protein
MLLGDLIGKLEEETIATETLLRIGNLGLLARMEAAATDAGVPLGTYASWAIRQYADNAPDDEWVLLIGALSRATDAGTTCLERAFIFVLASGDGDGH